MRKKTYCIRASVLYAGVAVMVLLALLAYYRNDLYELWKEKNGMEKVVYEGMKSELSDESLIIPGLFGSSAYFGIYTLGRYISFASNN